MSRLLTIATVQMRPARLADSRDVVVEGADTLFDFDRFCAPGASASITRQRAMILAPEESR